METIKSEKIYTEKGLFIGDPCYVFSHDTTTWSDLVNQMFEGSHYEQTKFNVRVNDKHKLAIIPTEYGDGYYPGSNNTGYTVDSGTIGITPIEVFEKTSNLNLGTVVEFKGYATIEKTAGVMKIIFSDESIKPIVIDTGY